MPPRSTPITFALGDALSVAMMRLLNFTPALFHDFPPAGLLGARLVTVNDLIHAGAEMPLVARSSKMPQVLLEISQKAFGVVGVVDDHSRLVGIITDGDLRRHMEGLLEYRASEVMTPNPSTIQPLALAEEALSQMNARKITCLFVLDPAQAVGPVGVLHIHDCLRAGLG